MDEIALVLIGHGSKLPYNKENLEKLAEILRKKSRFKTVEVSFMVRNKPTIPEAIEEIVKRGVKKIVLVPAFLAAGVHTTQEIPEMIGLKGEEPELKARGIEEPAPAVNYAESIPAAKETFTTSMVMIREALGNALDNVPSAHATIIERVVHTTADPEFAKLLLIPEGAVDAGVAAIKSGAKVVTDVKMVKAGINESRVRRFGGKTA